MAQEKLKTRWNVERRLAFIDFRLFWEGRINRGDLVAAFGISVPQASADFGHYQRAAFGNIEYDKAGKTYRATRTFRPVFFKPSADEYLAELRLTSAGLLDANDARIGRMPEFAVVPVLRRRLTAKTLRRVVQAIRKNVCLDVNYQSFSSPDPKWRQITPHALGFDGFRWHARAWCHTHGEFRDFVLSRILAVEKGRPSAVDPLTDTAWRQVVTLKLGVHPALSGGQRRAIELDFGMRDGYVEVTVRLCLSYYLERHLGLDLDPKQLPPARQQVVLLNGDELRAARRSAGTNPRNG